jgi:hypothetical protein
MIKSRRVGSRVKTKFMPIVQVIDPIIDRKWTEHPHIDRYYYLVAPDYHRLKTHIVRHDEL